MGVLTRSDPPIPRFQGAILGALSLYLAAAAVPANAAETTGHGPGEHRGEGSPSGGAIPSPYAGQQDARTTGLLPEEVEELTKGSGMAMALPAELNGYPGPRHVLDAADAGQLSLRPDQHEAVQRLYNRMLGEAKAKGQEVLQAEAHLALRFRHAHIDEPTLRDALEHIGGLRADLRFIHLRTHLETKALLTPEQVARYNALRGYDAGGGSGQHRGH